MTGKVDSAGLDWITYVTTEKGETKKLLMAAATAARELENSEMPFQHWKGLGYEGSKLGPYKWGDRKDGSGIMIISGSSATDGLILYELDIGHPTRVDLQVTFHLDTPNTRIAQKAYDQLSAMKASGKRTGYLKLIRSGTGDTVYVGRRSNNIMLRLYDKTHTYNPGYLGQYWRYEVEYKGVAAKQIFPRIAESKDIAICSIANVFAEYNKRKVLVPFSTETNITAIEVAATISTAETKLKWLEKCVAPVVVQLSLAGYDENVISALKLRGIMNDLRSKNHGS